MIEIIPAILTDSPIKFKDLVLRIEPYSTRVHIDIADGEFVPNKTVNGYEVIKDIATALKYDIHLMVARPQNILKEWFHTHAVRFTVHAESEDDLGETIKIIKEYKREVGVALNPETPVDKVSKYLENIDFIQFMTVNPGFQGGQFVEDVVDKIESFHEEYPDIMIMCDGAITPKTAPRLIKAGATSLISGSFIVKSGNIEKAIRELKEAREE